MRRRFTITHEIGHLMLHLMDYTNELRAKGKPMVDALLQAGPIRLRPILMTSAAIPAPAPERTLPHVALGQEQS